MGSLIDLAGKIVQFQKVQQAATLITTTTGHIVFDICGYGDGLDLDEKVQSGEVITPQVAIGGYTVPNFERKDLKDAEVMYYTVLAAGGGPSLVFACSADPGSDIEFGERAMTRIGKAKTTTQSKITRQADPATPTQKF
jgi:hypothetical protein